MSYLRRQVSSFFDAPSCRQGSRVYITFRQTADFNIFASICHTCVYMSYLCRQVSSLFDARSCRQGSKAYITPKQTSDFNIFASTCHTCVGRYPVFLTHSAAGREVEFYIALKQIAGFNIFSSTYHTCVYVSYLRRQVSSLFDASSCRQGSRVYITLKQISGFNIFTIF